jgi:hypothetical protein
MTLIGAARSARLSITLDRAIGEVRGSELFLIWLLKKTSDGAPSRRWMAISWAAFLLPTGPLGEPAGANIQRIKLL